MSRPRGRPRGSPDARCATTSVRASQSFTRSRSDSLNRSFRAAGRLRNQSANFREAEGKPSGGVEAKLSSSRFAPWKRAGGIFAHWYTCAPPSTSRPGIHRASARSTFNFFSLSTSNRARRRETAFCSQIVWNFRIQFAFNMSARPNGGTMERA